MAIDELCNQYEVTPDELLGFWRTQIEVLKNKNIVFNLQGLAIIIGHPLYARRYPDATCSHNLVKELIKELPSQLESWASKGKVKKYEEVQPGMESFMPNKGPWYQLVDENEH